MLTETTRQFLSLILEEEEKSEKPEKPEKPDNTEGIKLLRANTDNVLSKGRPIKDPGLANMKYRSNSTADDARQMLKDLEVSKPSGGNWYENLSSLLDSATSGELGAVFQSTQVVKSPTKKIGIILNLDPIWQQDDASGKRTYGFIRAVVMGAAKAGFLTVDSTTFKNLRVEQIEGKDAFLIYPSRKAMSWMQ